MNWLAIILWMLLMGVGIALMMFVSSRSFYRRNEMGIEEFSSYGHSVLVSIFESLVKLVGIVLIAAGGIKAFVIYADGAMVEERAQRVSPQEATIDPFEGLNINYGQRLNPPVPIEDPPFYTHVWDNTAKYNCCDFNTLQFVPETYRRQYYVMVFTVFDQRWYGGQHTYLKRLHEDIGDDIPIFVFRVNDATKGEPIMGAPQDLSDYVWQVGINSDGYSGTDTLRPEVRALKWLSQFDVGITESRLRNISGYGAFFPIILLVNKEGEAVASWGDITGNRGISGRHLSKEILTLVHGDNEKTRKLVDAIEDRPYTIPRLSLR